MKNYNIRDESGDKKYFTQIPNMIVNHSTAYEQSLYMIMKRLAGENGICFASQNRLAEMMGAHKNTVAITIKKLLDRKWIREIDKLSVRGGYVRQFVIVDLWSLNIKEYESGSNMTTNEKSGKLSGSNLSRSGSNLSESGSNLCTKKNYNKNYNKKEEALKKLREAIKTKKWS